LQVVIFSKDRACQLEALLRSMDRFVVHDHDRTVLFTASNGDYQRSYDELAHSQHRVDWVAEQHFKTDLMQILQAAQKRQARNVMFLVDDIVFIREFGGGELIRALDRDLDILAVSLRLGDNIDYCYMLDRVQEPPDFSAGRQWAWREASRGDWNYPMSVDGNIFRLEDIFWQIATTSFHNPNTLEAQLTGRPIDRPDMVCAESPFLVNMALNLVQDTFANRHGGISAEELNTRFLDGFAIDIEPITRGSYRSCHIEPELEFIRRPACLQGSP